MNTLLKILLPLIVLALGGLAAKELVDSRQLPVPEERPVPVPRVRTLAADLTSYTVHVPSQGSVAPRLESTLVTEVSGRVVHVSPNLVNGGFFEAGEELLRIDPRDFEPALTQARLDVARAQRRLSEEEADAQVAVREWESMGVGDATPLAKHEPQVAEAKASLAAAEALQERAQRNLARTRVTASFRGRVRKKLVDLGQFVAVGAPLATLYAIDVAEVRLPLPDAELAFLELPFGASNESRERRPTVQLSAQFAGQERTWSGRIVRTEGEIDPTTRMVVAVAEVNDPYRLNETEQEPGTPLALGMFVHARISGVVLNDVFVLPRTALRDGEQVYVIDDRGRLHFVQAEVIRTERDQVVLRAPLPGGTRFVISPLEIVTEGMRVQDVTSDAQGAVQESSR